MSFPKQRSMMLGRVTHRHDCGHFDTCYAPKTLSCRRCQTAAFNAEMVRQRYEDSLSTTELLERRA